MPCTAPPPSLPPSPAGKFVLEAAASIQFPATEAMLERLEREAINHVWQLKHIDSHQWESMEVPIGLVSSIRNKLIEQSALAKAEHKRERRGELSPTMTRPRDRELLQATSPKSKERNPPQEVVLSNKASRLFSEITIPVGCLDMRLASSSEDKRPGTFRPQISTDILSTEVIHNLALSPPLSPLQSQEPIDALSPPFMLVVRETEPLQSSSPLETNKDRKTELIKSDQQSLSATAATSRSEMLDSPVESLHVCFTSGQ